MLLYTCVPDEQTDRRRPFHSAPFYFGIISTTGPGYHNTHASNMQYINLSIYQYNTITYHIRWEPKCHNCIAECTHDDVIKWKHFPRYWPFVRGIHRPPVNSPHKGQWRGAFNVFFDLCLNKRLSKQSWGWWFETLWRPLWRQCNVEFWNYGSTLDDNLC